VTRNLGIKIAILTCAVAIAGCASSVKLPDLDVFNEPEFDAKDGNIGTYPEVADAPALPENIRRAAQWDASANAILRARDSFNAPEAVEPMKTEQQIVDEMKALKARVDAYKADDPQ